MSYFGLKYKFCYYAHPVIITWVYCVVASVALQWFSPQTQQHSWTEMWPCLVVFLVITVSGGCTGKDTSNLIEYKYAAFAESLQAGKTMFIFFARHGRLIAANVHVKQYGLLLIASFLQYKEKNIYIKKKNMIYYNVCSRQDIAVNNNV